jgi:hypothetical protein
MKYASLDRVIAGLLMARVGVDAGRIGPDLYVFHNPPRSERVRKSGSATRIVNVQSAGPQVARIPRLGSVILGFGFSFCFLKKKKKKKKKTNHDQSKC